MPPSPQRLGNIAVIVAACHIGRSRSSFSARRMTTAARRSWQAILPGRCDRTRPSRRRMVSVRIGRRYAGRHASFRAGKALAFAVRVGCRCSSGSLPRCASGSLTCCSDCSRFRICWSASRAASPASATAIPTYHGPRAFVTPSLMALDDIVHWLGLYTQMIACAQQRRRDVSVANDMAVVVNGHDVPQVFSRAEARAALGLPADGAHPRPDRPTEPSEEPEFQPGSDRRACLTRPLVLLGIGPDESGAEIADRGRGTGGPGSHCSRDRAWPDRTVLLGHRSGAVSLALRRLEPRRHRGDPCRRAGAVQRYSVVPRNVRRLAAPDRAAPAAGRRSRRLDRAHPGHSGRPRIAQRRSAASWRGCRRLTAST